MAHRQTFKPANWRKVAQASLRDSRTPRPDLSLPDSASLLAEVRADQAAQDRSVLGKVRAVFFKGARAGEERALAQRLAEIARGAPHLSFHYPLADPPDVVAPDVEPDKAD